MTKEIIFRLERSVNDDVERSPIMKMQTSPLIELEKKLELHELQVETEIEDLKKRIEALEKAK